MNEGDPARAKFFAIQALRMSGVAMVVVGILVIYGKIALPLEAGYVLFAVGLLDTLFMPTVLARIWRTPLP